MSNACDVSNASAVADATDGTNGADGTDITDVADKTDETDASDTTDLTYVWKMGSNNRVPYVYELSIVTKGTDGTDIIET